MSDPLSSLEKFGVLSRKFLHDTSNDFTAVGLNLHFIEKSIEADHPAYKDFQNLAVALKNLQQNTRTLMNWRRQLPDRLQPTRFEEALSLIPGINGWPIRSEIPPNLPLILKICPAWLTSLVRFLASSEQGTIVCKVINSPNDQCATNEQMNLIMESTEPPPPAPEIEWALHRELAKLMGGGIAVETSPQKNRSVLFLPVYPA